MQRKELLKGQLYRAGQEIIRVLDTSNSPVEAEVYDFIKQTFFPKLVQPRDIDGLARDFNPVQAYETFNAAAQQRQLVAQLDAFNARFAAKEGEEAKGAVRSQTRYTVPTPAQVTVYIPAITYNRAVRTIAPIDAVGVMTIPGDLFIRFTTQVGVLVQPVDDIAEVPFPGLLPEQVTTDAVQRVIADREARSARRGVVFSIKKEVSDLLTEEAQALEANAKKVAAGRYLTFRDLPGYKERGNQMLLERGVTEQEIVKHSF